MAHVYQVYARGSADNWFQECYREGNIALKGRNSEAMWLSDSSRPSLTANRWHRYNSSPGSAHTFPDTQHTESSGRQIGIYAL